TFGAGGALGRDLHFLDHRRQDRHDRLVGGDHQIDASGSLEVTEVNGIVNTEGRDIDLDEVGDFRRQTVDLDLALDRLQNSADVDASRSADEMERHAQLQLGVHVDFVEIGMQNPTPDRVT